MGVSALPVRFGKILNVCANYFNWDGYKGLDAEDYRLAHELKTTLEQQYRHTDIMVGDIVDFKYALMGNGGSPHDQYHGFTVYTNQGTSDADIQRDLIHRAKPWSELTEAA